MSRKAQHTRVKAVFFLATILLITLSLFSYLRINTLISSIEWVTHTQSVRLELERITSAVIDAETNQKSYLLAETVVALTRRDAAFSRLVAGLDAVDSLTHDNPTQIENMKALRSAIDVKLASMKKVMSLHAQPGKSQEFILSVAEGMELTERIKKQVNLMNGEEDRLLRIRSSSMEESASITPLFTVSLILGSIFILVASYFKIIQDLRISDNLQSSVERSKKELLLINETLRNKTAQLEEGQQLAHIGSWDWNVLTNKIEWTDELYRIYGLVPRQFEADYENFLKYIHPDDRDFVNGVVQKAFQSHEPFEFSHRVICPDGAIKVVSSTGKVFTDDKGTTIRMAGTAQDVTAQKKYEAGLRESEERFLKIFDNNPVPMTLSAIKTNKIKYANKLFYSTFGYSEQEVIGHTSEELNLVGPAENQRLIELIFGYLKESRSLTEVQALSMEETEELLVKLKQSEAMKNLEVLYTRKSGQTFPAVVSFEVIGFGAERYTITSYQDITERKNAQELLTRQNEALVRANKELESFNYVSSHDLQEPLRQIQNFASRLLTNEKQNLTDKGKTYLEKLNLSASRMRTLISDLLAYSRATDTERKFETVNLDAIVKDVTAEFREMIEDKRAVIEVGELGDAKVIPFQFRQMMHNIIGNSLKFSKPDLAPHIVIKNRMVHQSDVNNADLAPGKTYHHISIADNGTGFEPQYKNRIFEVFQRLHDGQKITGTGIGLAIVKKIVENHNGVITATSELDRGATFDIYIPVG